MAMGQNGQREEREGARKRAGERKREEERFSQARKKPMDALTHGRNLVPRSDARSLLEFNFPLYESNQLDNGRRLNSRLVKTPK